MLGQATGNTNSLDSPRLGLRGNHRLPPYSILCVTSSHLHPNGTFSRDSQGGVPKLSRFGLLGLWAFITPSSDLRLGWGLKQTYSSPWELSNGVSHSTCKHWDWVDSQLLVVRSQTTSLTPGPSFDHNLCYICSNCSCEAILDIYTSKPFQRYKEHLNARCFDSCNRALSFQESRRTLKSHFRECEWRPHTSLKVGLRQRDSCSTWKLRKTSTRFQQYMYLMHLVILHYCNLTWLWIYRRTWTLWGFFSMGNTFPKLHQIIRITYNSDPNVIHGGTITSFDA